MLLFSIMGKNLKENIISILESYTGVFISGEKLANDLNVSRAAVWKVIKSLKNEGYDILSVSNKGYALSKETDILSSKIIKDNMPKYRDKFNFVIYKTVESTNIVARGMAMNGADSGTVVIAEEQTSGYGRNGKSFFSPYLKLIQALYAVLKAASTDIFCLIMYVVKAPISSRALLLPTKTSLVI